jgi:hypothetical protein
VRERLARIGLAYLGLAGVWVGAWAQLAPRSFYDSFPGGGRHWVSVDGPFNEHLVRDFGGLNLALALVMLVGAVTLLPTLVRTAAAASLVFNVPHLLYHVAHRDVYTSSDQVANLGALFVTVAVAAGILAVWGVGGHTTER